MSIFLCDADVVVDEWRLFVFGIDDGFFERDHIIVSENQRVAIWLESFDHFAIANDLDLFDVVGTSDVSGKVAIDPEAMFYGSRCFSAHGDAGK